MNRLKINSNAPITYEFERWPAGAISLEGTHLQGAFPDLYRSEIDALTRFNTPSSDSELLPCEFLFVGLRHDEAADEEDGLDVDHDYHLYVTNLPKEWFSYREIAALYSVRWSIETLIQEAKSVFVLDETRVRTTESIECFVPASLVMVLLSRYLLRQIRAGLGSACNGSVKEETETQLMLFSKRFRASGTDILEMLAEQFGYSWEPGKTIIRSAIDLNVNHHALTERVAYGAVDPNLTKAEELAMLQPG